MNNIVIHPFNNFIETGLRIMSILNASFPRSLDLQTLLYLDYLTVHSGDLQGGAKSLHPAVPSRRGEILVRRNIIDDSLQIFEGKGLVRKIFESRGIMYSATDDTTPFLDSLSEEYFIELNDRAQWVVKNYITWNSNDLESHMRQFISAQSELFDINFLSNE